MHRNARIFSGSAVSIPTIPKTASVEQIWPDEKPSVEHVSLEHFLLQTELSKNKKHMEVTPLPMQPPDNQVKSMLKPALDGRWLRNAHLYRKLDIPADIYQQLDKLESRLGIKFETRILLLQSFVHMSTVQKVIEAGQLTPQQALPLSNDRLIPMGESLFNWTIQFHLLESHPTARPSVLSTFKSHLLDDVALASIASSLELHKLIIKCEQHSMESCESRTRANLLKAFCGAIYLDAGMLAVMDFCAKQILPRSAKQLSNYLASVYPKK